MKLGELAKLIRSKNAGPFWITFDIMFDSDADFDRAVAAQVVTRDWMAQTYGVSANAVVLVGLPAARAIKFSFPRPRVQGDPGETDMYSGQQYAQLMELEV